MKNNREPVIIVLEIILLGILFPFLYWLLGWEEVLKIYVYVILTVIVSSLIEILKAPNKTHTHVLLLIARKNKL